MNFKDTVIEAKLITVSLNIFCGKAQCQNSNFEFEFYKFNNQ